VSGRVELAGQQPAQETGKNKDSSKEENQSQHESGYQSTGLSFSNRRLIIRLHNFK
jgi:hypothetical protein